MQIDSHHEVRDSWMTDRMRVLRRDFLPERLAPELGATSACDRRLRAEPAPLAANPSVFCKLSGLNNEADWNN